MSATVKILYNFNGERINETYTRVTLSHYLDLVKLIESRFPRSAFKITYVDEEGDTCVVSNDEELKEAATLSSPLFQGKASP